MKTKLLMVAALALGAWAFAGQEAAKEKVKKPAKAEKMKAAASAAPGGKTMAKIEKSEEEWKKELPYETFCIMRQQGTEAPFRNKYWDHHEDGTYHCAACKLPLFRSDSKFDSGTGWPSYFQPYAPDAVSEKKDVSHGMIRVEANCSRCGGHLGHVFPDGPKPTGQRYCINSAALVFEPKAKK